MSDSQTVTERRAARKAAAAAAEAETYDNDLEHVDALEVAHGDSNVAVLRVPYSDGLPVLIAGRVPRPAEIKRFRSRVKANDQESTVSAAIELAAVCRLYPDKETWEKLVAARPGVDVQLGTECIKLAAARAEHEGKD